MDKQRTELEGYTLAMETNNNFDPLRIYRGRMKVNCAALSATFVENKKRGPRNKVVYQGNYVALSFSQIGNGYHFRFVNENMQEFKPTLVQAELGLAFLAMKKHRSENK